MQAPNPFHCGLLAGNVADYLGGGDAYAVLRLCTATAHDDVRACKAIQEHRAFIEGCRMFSEEHLERRHGTINNQRFYRNREGTEDDEWHPIPKEKQYDPDTPGIDNRWWPEEDPSSSIITARKAGLGCWTSVVAK